MMFCRVEKAMIGWLWYERGIGAYAPTSMHIWVGENTHCQCDYYKHNEWFSGLI